MTEGEAKAKWCPFSRLMDGGVDASEAATYRATPPVFNRQERAKTGVIAIPNGTRCVGSSCMAWRWTHGGPSNPVDSGDPGYCGLAGFTP